MSTVRFLLASGNFTQNWTGTDAALTTDNWNGIPSIVGYRGDELSNSAGTDPQTVLAPSNVVNLIANSLAASGTGGVHEIANDVVALQGSGTADAPSLVFFLDASGRQNIVFTATLRELDNTTVDQKFAVQYRIGGTGDFINLPAGAVSGVFNTTGNQTAALNVTLPTAANNQSQVDIRVITNDAPGADAMVGIDDISISSGAVPGYTGSFSIAPVVASIAEGNTAAAPGTDVGFTITRAFGTGASTVAYSIGGGIDTADVVGGQLTGSVAFAAGETSRTVFVTVNGDVLYENDEALSVALTSASGGSIAATTASATTSITNDDLAPAGGLLGFSAATASVIEGAANTTTPISFTVTRTDGSIGTVSAAYTVGFTGAAPANAADLVSGQALTGRVEFQDGETSKTITLNVRGDAIDEGNETFTVALSDVQGNAALSLSAPTSAVGTILNDDLTPIYAIQGTPAQQSATGGSPLAGQVVTTQGIVTARDTNGYYIQDVTGDGNTATSDAVLVFTGSAPAANLVVGALVQVVGTVIEFASTGNGAGAPSVTEISNSTATVISPTSVLPAAVTIGTGAYAIPGSNLAGALAVYESLEGMRVIVPAPLVTGPTTSAGEIFTVANNGIGSTGGNGRGNLLLTGGVESFGNTDTVGGDFQAERLVITNGLSTTLPTGLNTGAILNDVTGVFGQGFGYPEIQATSPVTVRTPSPLTKTGTTLVGDATHLLVASYNAENLDPLDPASRFTTVAGEIINRLNAPGIVAMQEIQDNDGATNSAVTSASTTLQMIVNAITAAGGPTYAFVDNSFINDDRNGGEPGGNIRTAYLYRTDTVTLVPGSLRTVAANGAAIADTGTPVGNAAANADQAINGNNPFNGSRPPLAADFLFNGEVVTIVNNHFTSKGGSDFTTGTVQPPLNAGEIARAAQAQAVNTFVDGVLATNPGARVIVTGDLNEYEFEQPLSVLKGVATVTNYNGTGQGTATYTPGGVAVLTDLQDILPADQRYDYVFDGVSQTLDHMLGTATLVKGGYAFQPVHINADFFDQTSDHDPLVSLFTITGGPVLLSSTPTDNAVGVATTANIVLTFNEDVRAGTGNILLQTNVGASFTIPVTSSQVTFSGRTVTIDPTNNLGFSAPYDVVIAAGVVTDLSGNAFAGIVVDALDFFTVPEPTAPADTPNPAVGTGSSVTVQNGANGNDIAYASGSFVLAPGASIEALSAANQMGTDPVNLTGNGFAQTIVGNMGANVIVGGGGADTLIGLGGSDTFLVTGQGEMVVEANGGGADLVYTTASYNLGSNEVEALSTVQQTDTTDINLIGNYVSQTIVGNYGNNVLNGGSGVDTLIGLFGNDTYAVGDSRIIIQEQAGQGTDIVVTSVDYVLVAGVSIETFAVQDRASTAAINLTGNEIAQTIVGSEGANVINGGAGSDTLIGFGGTDTFAFTTALGTTNVDTIVDFTAGTDRIALGSSIFAAIGTTLDASEFVTSTAATTATQFIVYNASTGALFYDADGSGAGAAVQFAAIAPNTALTSAMFTVV